MSNWIFTALLFVLFSFLGWVMETILVSYNTKKYVNRGFLVGPFCPIYGVGVSAIYLLLTPFSNNIILLFIMGIIITSILEYITSWLMELIFNARWWDYSHHKFNLNGRISLKISLYWGVLSAIVIKYVLPPIYSFIQVNIKEETAIIMLGFFSVYYVMDFSISAYNAFGLGRILKELRYIRSEISKSLENIKLVDIIGDIKIKTDEWNKNIEILTNDFIKGTLSERTIERINSVHSKLEELKDNYNANKLKTDAFFKKRLLKAFPNLQNLSKYKKTK